MSLVMGIILYFGRMSGVGEVSFRVRYPRLFDLSMYKEESVSRMCQLGWGRRVRRGAGGGGCLHEKRSW